MLNFALLANEAASEGVNGGVIAAIILGVIVFIGIIILISCVKVTGQTEKIIVERLGAYHTTWGTGIHLKAPFVDKIACRIDMKEQVRDFPPQSVITKDNVTVGVDAIVYFRVLDPAKALLETTNYIYATTNFAQAALRDITGNFELDELLSKRDEISAQIKEIVDKETDKWGIDIENVKLQNIELPADMKRAMAKQAEAERERRAAIIVADGEKAAAKAVSEAANQLASTKGGLEIRTLQTLEKISTDPSQKTVFVLPSDFKDLLGKK